MNMNMYSVRDVKTDTYSFPFQAPTNSAAIRSFGDLVGDEGNLVHRHPEDYSLYYVGAFDNVTGLPEYDAPPSFLENATSFANAAPHADL